MACADQGSDEKPSCAGCPNRERCHGRKPVVTQETVVRLVREVVLEVLAERGLTGPERSGRS